MPLESYICIYQRSSDSWTLTLEITTAHTLEDSLSCLLWISTLSTTYKKEARRWSNWRHTARPKTRRRGNEFLKIHLLLRARNVSFSQRAQSSCSTLDDAGLARAHHVDDRALNRLSLPPPTQNCGYWARSRVRLCSMTDVRLCAHGWRG